VPSPTHPLDATDIGASGVGSMPGEDPREAAATVVGELPDLPHLVELPARGPGADVVGRTSALLVDLHVDLQPSGWRLVDRPGRDEHRAASYLSQDLDAIEEATQKYAGMLKVQACGPWTLCAALQLPRGEPVLSDPGAVRDVAASLGEALAGHVADVRRRVPGAAVVVQLDEPSLPLVLAGRIRSMSGLRVVEALPENEAEAVLRALVEAAGCPVVMHCCAPSPPIALFHRSGAAGISLDCTLPDRDEKTEQALGEAVEAGLVLLAGVAASSGEQLSGAAGTVEPLRSLWRRLGLDPAAMASSVVATPTCGLAGASPDQARAALERCREVAQLLVDDPEG
jgi:methionine synthase II (cobalamin-independent)